MLCVLLLIESERRREMVLITSFERIEVCRKTAKKKMSLQEFETGFYAIVSQQITNKRTVASVVHGDKHVRNKRLRCYCFLGPHSQILSILYGLLKLFLPFPM